MLRSTLAASIIVLVGASSLAQSHKGINFQGVITSPSGSAPSVTGTSINLKVLAPNGCILREEDFTGVNISEGYVNVIVGQGSVSGSDPGLSLQNLFENSTPRTSLVCVNLDGTINGVLNSYTPVSNDPRKLRLDTTIAGDRILVDFNMRSMPFAINSETLNGKSESAFAGINPGLGVTQSNIESVFNRFTKLDSILNNFNAGGNTLSANITGNAATATTATNVTGVVAVANGGTGANNAGSARTNLGLGTLSTVSPTGTPDGTKYLRDDGTWAVVSGGGAVTSVAARTGAVVITSSDLADFNAASDARITTQKGNANGLASLDGSGKVPSAQLALSASDIPNLDYSKITSGAPTTVAGYNITDAVKNLGSGAGNVINGIQSGNTAGRPAFGTDGRLYLDTQAGVIYRDSGSAWVAVANANGAGGTISSLTGDVTATGSGAVAATVAKLQGFDVATTTPVDGKVLKYIGSATNKWSPSDIQFSDIKNSVGNSAFVGMGSCTSAQTVKWSSLTDTFECQSIAALDAGAITTGTINASRLPASATYWSAATGGINYAGGNVGIGTTSPLSTFQVGDGTAGFGAWTTGNASLYSASGGSLRISRSTTPTTGFALGTLSFDSGNPTTGYSSSGISAIATENWTLGSARGSRLDFKTMANGGTTQSTAMTVDHNGSVGIGTTTPRAQLDVQGVVLGKPAVNNASATVDFATGNLQYTSQNCQAFALHNMRDGGSYMFSVQGATSATCSFTAYTNAGTTPITLRLPPGHGATTASKHTIYNFVVLGTTVYASWIPGY